MIYLPEQHKRDFTQITGSKRGQCEEGQEEESTGKREKDSFFAGLSS